MLWQVPKIVEVIKEVQVEVFVDKIVEVPVIVEVIKEVEVRGTPSLARPRLEPSSWHPLSWHSFSLHLLPAPAPLQVRVETPVFHDREVEVVKYLPGEIVIKEVERLVREVVIREVPVEVIVTKEVAVEKIVYKIEQVNLTPSLTLTLTSAPT